jgi:hypothetical protein
LTSNSYRVPQFTNYCYQAIELVEKLLLQPLPASDSLLYLSSTMLFQ